MTHKIPEKLFRGDADLKNIRKLKETLNHEQLQTNLTSGGDGRKIFDISISNLIADHVDLGWVTTHFLSFSEDIETAKRYALGCDLTRTSDLFELYRDYYEDDKEWDFAIIEIAPQKIEWKEISRGIYEGSHYPTLRKFEKYPGYFKMLLIDVRNAIPKGCCLHNAKQIIENANRDKEWLLLPATEMILNQNKIQWSGIFDGYIISEINKYKMF